MAKLTVDDLQFMKDAKLALRFQHAHHHEQFKRDGQIVGDAYALGYDGPWGNDPAKFEERLGQLVERTFSSHIGPQESGSFLLLKNVRGSTDPVTDKGSYNIFHPAGAGHTFNQSDVVGEVQITPAALSAGIGADSREFSNLPKITAHLTNRIIEGIQEARHGARPTSAMELAEGRYPHGIEQTRQLLSRHLGFDGCDFRFNGEEMRIQQPKNSEDPVSRRNFERLKVLERKGALKWGFSGNDIVVHQANLESIAQHFRNGGKPDYKQGLASGSRPQAASAAPKTSVQRQFRPGL